jgi:NAD-dependent SIR2 family protein deacetylase
MATKYSSGKHSIAECDRCGQRYKLKELRKLILKTKQISVKVCPECWEPDQPQLLLGMYPVNDPQAVREPRPDVSYQVSGNTGLQTGQNNSFNIQEILRWNILKCYLIFKLNLLKI